MQNWKIRVLLTLLIIQIFSSPQLSRQDKRRTLSNKPQHSSFYFYQKMLIVRGLCMRNIQIQFERIQFTTKSTFQVSRALSDMDALLSNEKLIQFNLMQRKQRGMLSPKEYQTLFLFLVQIDLWAKILSCIMDSEIQKFQAPIRPSSKPLFEAFQTVLQFHTPRSSFQKLLEKVWDHCWTIRSIYCNFLRILREFVGTKAQQQSQINAIKQSLAFFQKQLYSLRKEVHKMRHLTHTERKYLEEDLGDMFALAKRLSQDIKTFKFREKARDESSSKEMNIFRSLRKEIKRGRSFNGRSTQGNGQPQVKGKWPSTQIY